MLITAVIIIMLVASVGIYRLTAQSISAVNTTPSPLPEAIPISTPTPSPTPAPTPNQAAFEREQARILAMDWGEQTELSFYIKNLETGESQLYNNHAMNSASMIKLFIMVEAFARDNDGTIKFTPEIENGVELMITVSDNNASRALTDLYYPQNIETVNLTLSGVKNASRFVMPVSFAGQGFSDSILERKMYDTSLPNIAGGRENLTSVEDVAKLLEQIYNGECISEEASARMLSLLQRQELTYKIPHYLEGHYPFVEVANKTGELNQVENDAAIITGAGIEDFIFVIMVDSSSSVAQGDRLKNTIIDNIAEIALDLVAGFEKETNQTGINY